MFAYKITDKQIFKETGNVKKPNKCLKQEVDTAQSEFWGSA